MSLGIIIPIVVVVVVVAAIVIWAVVQQNGLVSRRNTVDESLGQIETQVQRRYDLIPNLVETVQDYAKHEAGVFEEITKARAEAGKAVESGTPEGIAKADRLLKDAALQINAVAENYPDLKASANYAQLQEELTSTENKVAFARQAYNDSVNDYNTKREQFPASIIAKALNFNKRDMYSVDDPEARKAVKVKFNR